MNKMKVLSVLSFAIMIGYPAYTQAQTAQCAVENNFDYVGNDLYSVPDADGSKCCDRCQFAKECTAWTWSNFNGGTCWLKSGRGQVVFSPALKSGQLDTTYPTTLSGNIDYVNRDIGSKLAPQAQDCFEICRNTDNCRAFSWNNYNQGTCWLKSDVDQVLSNQNGVQAAKVYPDPPKPWSSMMQDTDFIGNDIGSVLSKDPNGCVDICSKTSNCHTFSWNSYNGGTCWLKSTVTEIQTNPGVVSSIVSTKKPFCYIQKNTDFYGTPMATLPGATSDDCCPLCYGNPKCKGFTWNNWNNGTCYLKEAFARPYTKSGVSSCVFV